MLSWEELVTLRGAAPPRHRFVEDADSLAAVRAADVNLCVWRRALAPPLARWLEAVRHGRDFGEQVELSAASPDAAALVAPLSPCDERDALRRDIEDLAARYAAIVASPVVLASLGTVAHDMCRKFHVDRVGVRCLCTYAGPGTEWAPEHAVLREGLGKSGPTLAASNLAVVPDEAEVRHLEAGWVGLLKARLPHPPERVENLRPRGLARTYRAGGALVQFSTIVVPLDRSCRDRSLWRGGALVGPASAHGPARHR